MARETSKLKYPRKHEFECIVCLKVCLGAQEFRSHLLTHGIGKSYRCNECSQTFKSKESLRRHINKHEGKKPFLCDTCGKGFCTNQILKGHAASHHNEKPFSCSTCGRAFAHHSGLSRHMIVHSGRPNHICHICGQLFLTSAYLTSHMLSHSGERSFTCKVCHHQFKHRSSLSRHCTQHHKELKGDKSETCSLCPNTHFSSADSLSKHTKKFHPEGKAGSLKDLEKDYGPISKFQDSDLRNELLGQFRLSSKLEVSCFSAEEKSLKDSLNFAHKCQSLPIPVNIEVFKSITNMIKQISDRLATSGENVSAAHFEKQLTALRILQSIVNNNLLFIKRKIKNVY
ncbi:hypothetical protein J437_LFUL003422 [Ladona fulva]|uniref:C2H2-type domain-containing protein n=1 Tax=Ladona fulva TaxID=123851 RepID=A0A8K0K3P0_LADFU|nr:hypothetical protein J437_LFUL003422 [Ladona fulva]